MLEPYHYRMMAYHMIIIWNYLFLHWPSRFCSLGYGLLPNLLVSSQLRRLLIILVHSTLKHIVKRKKVCLLCRTGNAIKVCIVLYIFLVTRSFLEILRLGFKKIKYVRIVSSKHCHLYYLNKVWGNF